MNGPNDDDAAEQEAEARAEDWRYVTRWDEDAAEDRWGRRGVL